MREGGSDGTDRSAALRVTVILGLITLLLIIFPPFHIRPIDTQHRVTASDHSASADIALKATRFWDTKLTAAQLHPTDWLVLIKALQGDPVQAGQAYGRRPAIGGSSYYLVSGEGRVVSIDSRGLWLGAPALGDWRVLLQTGPIFGSALRDATGLLELEDFSSFDFNELGAQLNRLSEARVGSMLRKNTQLGTQLEFVAAARLDPVSGDAHTLLLAPIKVSLE